MGAQISTVDTAAAAFEEIIEERKQNQQEIAQLKRTVEQLHEQRDAKDEKLKRYAEFGIEELLEDYDGAKYILVRLTDQQIWAKMLVQTKRLLGTTSDLNIRTVVEACIDHCMNPAVWAQVKNRRFNNAIEYRKNT